MFCCHWVRLALLALCIAPAVAQRAAADHPQRHAFLAVNREFSLLKTVLSDTAAPAFSFFDVADGGTPAAAPAGAFISVGVLPRRLSLDRFFAPDRREQLLGNVGEREREQEENAGQQAQSFSSVTEAVPSPGMQLYTHLPERQRPLPGISHENIESPFPRSAARLRPEIAASTLVAASWRRNDSAAQTASPYGPTALVDTAAGAAEQAAAHGIDNDAVGASAAGAPHDGDAAYTALLTVAGMSEPVPATVAWPTERQFQAQKILFVSDSPDQEGNRDSNASLSQLAAGFSAAASSRVRTLNGGNHNPDQHDGATQNGVGTSSASNASEDGSRDDIRQAAVKEAQTAVEHQGKTEEMLSERVAAPSSILNFLLFADDEEHRTTGKAAADPAVEDVLSDLNPQNQSLRATGIDGVSANAARTLDTQLTAVSSGTGAADSVLTSNVVSSTLPALSAAAGSSLGWLPFGGTSSRSSSTAEEQGTGEVARSLPSELKVAVGTVKDTAVDEAKKAVKTVRETAQEEVSKRTGPFSKVLWFFNASKEEKEQAAAKGAVKAALSNVTKDQTAAAAGILGGAYAGATQGDSAEGQSPAAAPEEGQKAGIRLGASSFTSRFLPQWLASETEEATSEASSSAAAVPARGSWWFSGDASHATAEQQQQQLSSSSSSAWWANPTASGGGLKEVTDTVQNVAVDKAKEVIETAREPDEEKSRSSSRLPDLMWFFTSSKEEKKEAAAKAAVKAALSWIADCQQQVQAAVKTLLPASTSQSIKTSAAPDSSDKAGAATSKKSADALSRNEPTFFQLEDVLQRLSARQQQLSEFTDAEATSWYDWMQQRVMEQGMTAALADWLYAGSSDSSTKINRASQPYFPRAQHVGAPSVSTPFFPTGLWSSAEGSDFRQQQQKRAQLMHGKSAPPTLFRWLHEFFTRRDVGDGEAHAPAAPGEHQQEDTVTQTGLSSWTGWIGGNRQPTGTQASNLIRKAATATSTGSQSKSWSEKSAAVLPLAGAASWLPSSRSSSANTTTNSSRIGSFWSSKSLEAKEPAAGKPEEILAAAAGAVDGGLFSKVAASLQSAVVAAQKDEETESAKNEPIRAPGLHRGAYWWEWQAYPNGEVTENTKTPMYTRHIHLDCDPVLPFQACVHGCQKESAQSLLSSKKAKEAEGTGSGNESEEARPAEPLALDSYEYSTLRSCYLKCKQKWLDTDLPGCLRADGVKVEGVPPAAAYRSTTTTTTTTTTATTPSTPRAEAPASSAEQPQSFWSRMRDKKQEQPLSDMNASEESRRTSSFSLFHLRAPAEKLPSPTPEAEQEERSIKNFFGLLQRRTVVPQTAAPTVRESIMRFPQTLWNHLKSGEANAADATGAAATLASVSSSWGANSSQLSAATEAALAEGANDTDVNTSQGAAGSIRSWWNLLLTDAKKGEQQSHQVAPIAAEQRIQAVPGTHRPEAAQDAAKAKLTFSHWCVLLVLCIGGALVSIWLVRLRRRGILTRLWSMFQSDESAHAAASWLSWHTLYEQISPKNEGCMQQCMQHLSFRSAERGTNEFEKSEGATQPLICDNRPSL